VTWTIRSRTVLVTGGTSGIGRAVATALSAAGADVTITARRREAGSEVASDIIRSTGRPIGVLILDLADRSSVAAAIDEFLHEHHDLAVLVNNAGAVFGRRSLTPDGVERTLAVNHVGPFQLTLGLMPLLISSAPSRVVNVASSAHGWARDGFPFDDPHMERGYSQRVAYGQSKLANILHARSLAVRYGDRGLSAYAVHPGLVRTSIGRDGDSILASAAYRLFRWRMQTPAEGADTVVWLASTPDPPEPNGAYFDHRSIARSTRWARDDELAERLWGFTEDVLARAEPPP
jgi:NAD(P)-dependent dehydrogenase (short-subunit alcohol dehydrogenase family)